MSCAHNKEQEQRDMGPTYVYGKVLYSVLVLVLVSYLVL
jgi:hypothetical protein